MGDLQCTKDRRNAAITEDLVLQARAKLDNKFTGPEDEIVSEMVKRLPLTESPSSWKIVKLVFLRKPGAASQQGIRSYRAIALSSVMSKWYASCIILRLERSKEPENWKNLHFGGVAGTNCQHLQVMMTNLLQKHLERQDEGNPVLRHRSVGRPTMHLKTAFDEAKPKHVAQILDYHDTHGWLVAALLCKMSGL